MNYSLASPHVPMISTLTITGAGQCIGFLGFFGRVTSTLLICKAFNKAARWLCLPFPCKASFYSQPRPSFSGCFPRVCAPKNLRLSHQDQPKKSPGNRWQSGTRDQPLPRPRPQLGGLPSTRHCTRQNWQDRPLLPHGHLPAPQHAQPAPRSPLPTRRGRRGPQPRPRPRARYFSALKHAPLPPKGCFGVPTFQGGLGASLRSWG